MKYIINFTFCIITFLCCNRRTHPSSTTISDATTSAKQATTSGDSILSIPTCIQQKIDSIKKEKVWNPPAHINEYEYNGGKVYVISAPCCDFFVTAVDANCNYICAPAGGFTGIGDRKCSDFNQKAKFIRVVWKDERGGKGGN